MGDYTVEGKLLSFCPVCGGMLPPLEVDLLFEKEEISRTQMKQIGVQTAKKLNLDYKLVYSIVKNMYGKNKDEFADSFCFRLKVEFGVEVTSESLF